MGKTRERMERGSRKRSSSAGSEKIEKVGDRKKWKDIVGQAKAHRRRRRRRRYGTVNI